MIASKFLILTLLLQLSPALRNRLTEIWCDTTTEKDDLELIIEHNLHASLKDQNVGKTLISFAAAHAVLGWAVGNERVRAFVKERTSYRFRERIRRTLLRQDVLPADVRARLEPLFADDVARLRAMLGADGPDWLTSEGTT